MGSIAKYKEKLKKELEENRNKTREKYFSEVVTPLSVVLFYATLIYCVSECANMILGIEAVQKILATIYNNTIADWIYPLQYKLEYNYDMNGIYKNLGELKQYAWVLSYCFMAFLMGLFHLNKSRDKYIFKTTLEVSTVLAFFKLYLYSFKFGALAFFTAFAPLLMKYYVEVTLAFTVCFVFFYMGTEIMSFRKNNAQLD